MDVEIPEDYFWKKISIVAAKTFDWSLDCFWPQEKEQIMVLLEEWAKFVCPQGLPKCTDTQNSSSIGEEKVLATFTKYKSILSMASKVRTFI